MSLHKPDPGLVEIVARAIYDADTDSSDYDAMARAAIAAIAKAMAEPGGKMIAMESHER